jgi:plasmid stabilization system protein ParE
VVKIKPKIVIDNLAKAQLKEAYTYIKLDSPNNAEKVRAKILTSISQLAVSLKNIAKTSTA